MRTLLGKLSQSSRTGQRILTRATVTSSMFSAVIKVLFLLGILQQFVVVVIVFVVTKHD